MRLNVEIKKNIYLEFLEHAKDEGRSISDIVRVLILEWNKKKRDEKNIVDLKIDPTLHNEMIGG